MIAPKMLQSSKEKVPKELLSAVVFLGAMRLCVVSTAEAAEGLGKFPFSWLAAEGGKTNSQPRRTIPPRLGAPRRA